MSLSDYFYFEAKEKCYEIEIRSLKDFEKERQRLFELGKQQVHEEYEKKFKQYETAWKIKKSGVINKARVEKMNARNKVLMKMLDKAEVQVIKKFEEDPSSYEALMKKLIVQAFLKLMEQQVTVRCLERDVALVEKLLPSSKQLFREICKKELDFDFPIEAEIDKKRFLELRKIHPKASADDDEGSQDPARVPKNEEDKKCIGGVLVTTSDGAIVCKNTIDIRLDIVYQESLPVVRQLFFS